MILGIAGKKSAGKDSSAKYLMGHIIKQAGVVEKFDVNDNGELLVNYEMKDEKNKVHSGMGVFDLNQNDEPFLVYMEEVIHPHVTFKYFATLLKEIAHTLYGIPYEYLYGSEQDKNNLTGYKYRDFEPNLAKKNKRDWKLDKDLTVREFMQLIGDYMRAIDDKCFVNATIRECQASHSNFIIIPDVRFVPEIEAIKAAGGKVIYQTRSIDGDGHKSETELDDVYNKLCDVVIDNQNLGMKEKNLAVLNAVKSFGWITEE